MALTTPECSPPTIHSQAHVYARAHSCHLLGCVWVPNGPTRNPSSLLQVSALMESLWLTSMRSRKPQTPHFTWSSHSPCHPTMGYFLSPPFPSMHPLSLRQKLSSLMSRIQKSCSTPRRVKNITYHQDSSLLMDPPLHVQHHNKRSMFGRTLPLVMSPGVTSSHDPHLRNSPSHPL